MSHGVPVSGTRDDSTGERSVIFAAPADYRLSPLGEIVGEGATRSVGPQTDCIDRQPNIAVPNAEFQSRLW
jgi:hypothetical protein